MHTLDRRSFVTRGLLTTAVFIGSPRIALPFKEDGKVSTNEDLMREHGILKRVLLIYDEGIRRSASKRDLDFSHIKDGATIIRDFIEKYHEKLEEDHLFPRFRKANKLVDLVNVLLVQHEAGRRVTARILAAKPSNGDEWDAVRRDLEAFARMYSPHEAREDTVLFPALHEIVSAHEYDALGEEFESIERKTFGGDGFDIYRDKVEKIEKAMGIYDLAQFTPQ